MNKKIYLAICKCGSIISSFSCDDKELEIYQDVILLWMCKGLSIVPGKKLAESEPCGCHLPPTERKISTRALRDQLGMSQRELAEFLGICESSIQKIEYGTSKGRGTHKLLTDLCFRFPVVIKLIKIIRGMDIGEVEKPFTETDEEFIAENNVHFCVREGKTIPEIEPGKNRVREYFKEKE